MQRNIKESKNKYVEGGRKAGCWQVKMNGCESNVKVCVIYMFVQ